MTYKELRETPSTQKRTKFRTLVDVLIIFVLPVLCEIIETSLAHVSANGMLLGKWFLFWAFGFRLFTAGINQASDPAFTAIKIFKINNNDGYEIIRKLGFANMCLGIGGILSLINDGWRPIITILGCVFFGMAGIRHVTDKIITGNQKLVMVTDLMIFVIILIYAIYILR